jgi:hypothetical protein
MSKGLLARKLFDLRVLKFLVCVCCFWLEIAFRVWLVSVEYLHFFRKIDIIFVFFCAQEFVEDSDPKTHERLMMVAAGNSPEK